MKINLKFVAYGVICSLFIATFISILSEVTLQKNTGAHENDKFICKIEKRLGHINNLILTCSEVGSDE